MAQVGRFFDRIRKSDEALGVLVGVATSITYLLTVLKKLPTGVTPEAVLIGIDLLNIAVLGLALWAIKAVELDVTDQEFDKLRTSLKLGPENSIRRTRRRVNLLVAQLVFCIKCFCWILAFFYAFQVLWDAFLPSFEEVSDALLNEESVPGLLAHGHWRSVDAARYLCAETFANAANLFSASFLFLAFQVLFIVTLSKSGGRWQFKPAAPFGLAFVIMLGNLYLFLIGHSGLSLITSSHMVRLAGGIYNGVAMALLFSRFISMEYFFQRSKFDWQRRFYFVGTIVILPLYVVAQPLYGLFNAVHQGDPVIFKALVFLMCFWGKLVLLLFIYTMIKKKWLHSYMLMVLSNNDAMKKISEDLDDVVNL